MQHPMLPPVGAAPDFELPPHIQGVPPARPPAGLFDPEQPLPHFFSFGNWQPQRPQEPLPLTQPYGDFAPVDPLQRVEQMPDLLPLPPTAYPPGFRYPDGSAPGQAPGLFPLGQQFQQPQQQERGQQQSDPLSQAYIQELVRQSLNPLPEPQPQQSPFASAFQDLLTQRAPQPQEPSFQQPTFDPTNSIEAAANFQNTVRQNDNAILPILAAAAFGNQLNSPQRRSERGEFDSLHQSAEDIAEQYRMNQTPYRGPYYG